MKIRIICKTHGVSQIPAGDELHWIQEDEEYRLDYGDLWCPEPSFVRHDIVAKVYDSDGNWLADASTSVWVC